MGQSKRVWLQGEAEQRVSVGGAHAPSRVDLKEWDEVCLLNAELPAREGGGGAYLSGGSEVIRPARILRVAGQ